MSGKRDIFIFLLFFFYLCVLSFTGELLIIFILTMITIVTANYVNADNQAKDDEGGNDKDN